LIASLGSYVYSVASGEAAVHLYVQGQGRMEVDGTSLTLTQITRYPWDGEIAIRVDPQDPADFALRLRIPEWCRSAELTVNEQAIDLSRVIDRGYAHVGRRWQKGDQVKLTLGMPVERVYAHPDVRANQGRVALRRGPVVYCLEAIDNPAPLHRLALSRVEEIASQFERDLLGGVTTLTGRADATQSTDDRLYSGRPWGSEGVPFKAVPYHVWAHRGPGAMLVWLPEI
jgi:DUF1680 family protein